MEKIIVDIDRLEEEKELFYLEYEKKVISIYKKEIGKIFRWFKESFPNHTIKWCSGMGTCFWILDDNILEWDERTTKFMDRRIDILKPVYDFYMAINSSDYAYRTQWIHLGDINMEDGVKL